MEAMALYDTDGDDSLSRAELAECPAMLAMLLAYDTDGSDTVERDEIVQHVREMWDFRVGLTQLQCAVKYNGQPLPGAHVELVPEPYLGTDMATAEGTTDDRGYARVRIPPEQLPRNLQGLPGMRFGTYKVRITHPQVSIPARYNTETELGYESQPGVPSVTFSLKNR